MADNEQNLQEREREQLLTRLEQLRQEGLRYVAEIERITKAAGPGHALGHGDGSITLIEDEDDARVISMKPRQQLHRVYEQLKALHAKALELGMGDDPRIKGLGDVLQPAEA